MYQCHLKHEHCSSYKLRGDSVSVSLKHGVQSTSALWYARMLSVS